jgi:hypothetical protein
MARTSTASSTEVLAGLVDRVTFHNSENGFCVLRVKARGQRDLITLVGHAAMISAGEFIQASGGWVNDRTHGVQFRASFLKATAPTTVEGIEKYLASGMIRGIGPVYARFRTFYAVALCLPVEWVSWDIIPHCQPLPSGIETGLANSNGPPSVQQFRLHPLVIRTVPEWHVALTTM